MGLEKRCVTSLLQQAAALQLAADQRTRASDHVAEFPAQFASAQGVASKYRVHEAGGSQGGVIGADDAQATADRHSQIRETRPQLEALRRWSVKCAVHARAVAAGSPWLAALSWLLRGQVLSVLPSMPLRIAAGVSQANALTPRMGPVQTLEDATGLATSSSSGGTRSPAASMPQDPAAIGSRIMALQHLPLPDRLGFLCRFCPIDEVKTVARGAVAASIRQGRLEALPLTGLGRAGVRLLQRYVDRPGRDVSRLHIAAVLGAYAAPWSLDEASAQRVVDWMVALRQWLNSRRLWQARAALDCDRGRLARAAAAALRARVLAASKKNEPEQEHEASGTKRTGTGSSGASPSASSSGL